METRSNGEGYSDPTADAAVTKADRERRRAHGSDRDKQSNNRKRSGDRSNS